MMPSNHLIVCCPLLLLPSILPSIRVFPNESVLCIRCPKYGYASKVMLKILHARLQHYANQELPDVQAGFREGRGSRDQVASIHCITEKAREFHKDIYLCFIDYAKAFDCVDNKLW